MVTFQKNTRMSAKEKAKSSAGQASWGHSALQAMEVIEADPDTAWDLWDTAQAALDSRFMPEALREQAKVPLPDISAAFEAPAAPPARVVAVLKTGLTLIQRQEAALQTVSRHHPRVAQTIRSLWGYQECSNYLNELVLSGSDNKGQQRQGFNAEAAQAMMALTDLHDRAFGAKLQSASAQEKEVAYRSGWDRMR